MRCKLMTSSYSLICSCVVFSVAYSPSSVSPALEHSVDKMGLIMGKKGGEMRLSIQFVYENNEIPAADTF